MVRWLLSIPKRRWNGGREIIAGNLISKLSVAVFAKHIMPHGRDNWKFDNRSKLKVCWIDIRTCLEQHVWSKGKIFVYWRATNTCELSRPQAMSNAVIHPGDKVTLTLSLDGKALSNSNNEHTIKQGYRTIQETPDLQKQENLKKQDATMTPPKKPPLVSRRTSSLLSLNIEGLLVVPELESRLRRKSFSGICVHDGKETEVDPSDGMLTTSLCTTELWRTLLKRFDSEVLLLLCG